VVSIDEEDVHKRFVLTMPKKSTFQQVCFISMVSANSASERVSLCRSFTSKGNEAMEIDESGVAELKCSAFHQRLTPYIILN
jgi:hypothetical protein